MFPPPAFPATNPELRERTVERTFRYTVRRYTPEARAALPASRAVADLKTPEGALAAFYGAMVAGDSAWFDTLWTTESRRFNAEHARRTGITPEKLRAAWSQGFKGAQLVLTRRVESGPWVLLDHRIERAPLPPLENTSVVVLEDQSWRVTQELATHPLLVHLKRGDRIAREGVIPWPIEGRRAASQAAPETPFPAAPFPVEAPQERTFSVESIYRFELLRYQPAVALSPVAREGARYATPEETAQGYLAALEAKDAAWQAEACDPRTRELLRERERPNGPDGPNGPDNAGGRPLDPAAETPSIAPKSGEPLRLTARFQLQDFVVLVFRPTDGQPAAERLLTTTRDGDAWRVTRAIDADPLLRLWDRKEPRIRYDDLFPEALVPKGPLPKSPGKSEAPSPQKRAGSK